MHSNNIAPASGSPLLQTALDLEAELERLLSEPPKILHYLRKDDILRNVVQGDRVWALCGERFEPGAVDAAVGQIGRRRRRPTVICEACQRVYNRLEP